MSALEVWVLSAVAGLSVGSHVLIAVAMVKTKALQDDVKSLRESRHSHGNAFADHGARISDLERRLEKLGNGD